MSNEHRMSTASSSAEDAVVVKMEALEAEELRQSETAAALAPPPSPDELCALCGELFSVPRALACLHVFDQHCLERLVSPSETQLQCPVCSEVQPLKQSGAAGIAALPFAHGVLLRLIHRGLHPRCTLCSSLKHAVAVSVCVDCPALLCPVAHRLHSRIHQFTQHRVRTLAALRALSYSDFSVAVSEQLAPEALCAQHFLPAVAYCFDCRLCVCACDRAAHADHSLACTSSPFALLPRSDSDSRASCDATALEAQSPTWHAMAALEQELGPRIERALHIVDSVTEHEYVDAARAQFAQLRALIEKHLCEENEQFERLMEIEQQKWKDARAQVSELLELLEDAEFEDKIDPAEATIAQVERRVTQLNERLGVPLDSSADTRDCVAVVEAILHSVGCAPGKQLDHSALADIVARSVRFELFDVPEPPALPAGGISRRSPETTTEFDSKGAEQLASELGARQMESGGADEGAVLENGARVPSIDELQVAPISNGTSNGGSAQASLSPHKRPHLSVDSVDSATAALLLSEALHAVGFRRAAITANERMCARSPRAIAYTQHSNASSHELHPGRRGEAGQKRKREDKFASIASRNRKVSSLATSVVPPGVSAVSARSPASHQNRRSASRPALVISSANDTTSHIGRPRRSYISALYPTPDLELLGGGEVNTRRPHRLADVDWSAQHLLYFARDRFIRVFQLPKPTGTFRCVLCDASLQHAELQQLPLHLRSCLPKHPAAARATLLYAKQIDASLTSQHKRDNDRDSADEEEEFANVQQTRTDHFSVTEYLCCRNRRFEYRKRPNQTLSNQKQKVLAKKIRNTGASRANHATNSRTTASFSRTPRVNSVASTFSLPQSRGQTSVTRATPQQTGPSGPVSKPRPRGRRSSFLNYAQMVVVEGHAGKCYKCNACGGITSRNVSTLRGHLLQCYPKQEVEQLFKTRERTRRRGKHETTSRPQSEKSESRFQDEKSGGTAAHGSSTAFKPGVVPKPVLLKPLPPLLPSTHSTPPAATASSLSSAAIGDDCTDADEPADQQFLFHLYKDGPAGVSTGSQSFSHSVSLAKPTAPEVKPQASKAVMAVDSVAVQTLVQRNSSQQLLCDECGLLLYNFPRAALHYRSSHPARLDAAIRASKLVATTSRS